MDTSNNMAITFTPASQINSETNTQQPISAPSAGGVNFTPGVFNPKPVSTSPFNPNTPGNTFTKPTPAGATSMQYKPSDNTSIVKGLFGTTKIVNGREVPDTQGSIGEGVQSFGKNVGQDYMDMTKNLGSDTQQGTSIMQDGLNNGGVKNLLLNPKVGAKEGVNLLKTGADALAGIFSPITELIKPSIQNASQGLENNKTFSNIANSGTGNSIASAQDKYQTWKAQNPTKATALESSLTDLMASLGEEPANKAAAAITDTAKDATKSGTSIISNAASDLGNKISETNDTINANAAADTKASIKSDFSKPITVTKPMYNKATDIFKNAASQGHDISDTLVNNKINPADLNDNGMYSTTDTADKIRADAGKMSSDLLRPSLEKADVGVSLTPVDDITNQAIADIKNSKGITAGDMKSQIAKAQAEGIALKEKYPNGMKLSEMHDENINYARNGGYKPMGTVEDNNTAATNRAMGRTLDKQVAAKAPSDIPVKQFKGELQKQYQAADYLDALNGKKVPVSIAGKIRATAGKIVGATVGGGLGGGILGTAAGYHLGGMLESLLENVPNPVKNSFLKNLETTNPEAFSKVQEFLNNGKVTPIQTIKPADLSTTDINPDGMVKVNDYSKPFSKKYVPQSSDMNANASKIVQQQLGEEHPGMIKGTQLTKGAKNQATRTMLTKMGKFARAKKM